MIFINQMKVYIGILYTLQQHILISLLMYQNFKIDLHFAVNIYIRLQEYDYILKELRVL